MMPHKVKLLHVEDDEAMRLVVAHLLRALEVCEFEATYAASEDEAVEAFSCTKPDLVILDYQLERGDGLNCLRRLREMDEAVPIIALSGHASPRVAAELLDAGADDFVSKRDQLGKVLPGVIGDALVRAEGLRRQMVSDDTAEATAAAALLLQAMEAFVGRFGPELATSLNEVEAAARRADLSPDRLVRMFLAACRRLDADGRNGVPTEITARPFLLEVLLRLGVGLNPGE